MLDKIKNLKFSYVAYAALLAVLGLCFLTFSASKVTLTVIVGIFIAFLGGAALALAILGTQRGSGFIIKLILSAICIACGIATIVLNDKAFMAILFTVCLIALTDGAFKFKLSLSCKKHEVGGWWIIAIPSAMIILSAFTLSSLTPESKTVTCAWAGVTLIALAALNVASAVWSSKCKTAEKAEIYYEVYRDIKDSGEL